MEITQNVKFLVVLLVIAGASASTIGMTVSTVANLTTDVEDLQTELDATIGEYNETLLQQENLLSNYSELLAVLNILSLENELLNQTYNDLLLDFQNLQDDYDELLVDYNGLYQDYQDLQANYTSLQDQYTILLDLYDSLVLANDLLQANFDQLQADFDNLQLAYTILQTQYDTITDTIQQMILPAQYTVFAEAVRRYYFDDYIAGDTYRGFTRFCRDIILHDSIGSYSPDIIFPEVSDAFADCLRYGSNTGYLAFQIFYWVFWSWLPNWNGYGLSGNPTTDISTIVQWCCNNIDYEYDSKITTYQLNPLWDYPKFPVETAFRTFGDCEDQAILCAAYLESCGFETMMVTIHDPDWNGGSGLYHGVPMIWWNNTWGSNPQHGFSFWWDGTKYNDGWWMFLDTTWDTPFGTDPTWLQWYKDTDIMQIFDENKFSSAVCDIGGYVSPPP